MACGDDGGGVVYDSADGPSGACGNGMVEEGEACDGGEDCTAVCTLHECGDALLGPGEKCDDGNEEDDDGCTNACVLGPAAIVDIALAEYYTCALSLSSRVKCWGSADNGRLGQPGYAEHIGDDEHPSDWEDVAVADDVVELVAGREHVCALRDSGNVICWGYNGSRQLGYDHNENVGFDESPAEAGDLALAGVTALAAGDGHTCALARGAVSCWGSNNAGQLGYGDTMASGEGTAAGSRGPVPLTGDVVQIAAGASHTCARLEGGDVICWGSNAHGQLGTGNPESIGDDETPSGLSPIKLGGDAVDIDAGGDTTCAVLDDGGLRCWGANIRGILGNGDTADVGDRKTPEEQGVVLFDGDAVQVQVGTAHACATASDGKIYCWGSEKRVGYPDADFEALPGRAVALGVDAIAVKIGLEHTCAITSAAGVRCWGRNTGFRLGNPEISGSAAVLQPSKYGDVAVF